jgi:hypothetical protein
VGWDLIPPLAAVNSNRPVRVDREPLVRVHSDTEEAGVGLKNKQKVFYMRAGLLDPDSITFVDPDPGAIKCRKKCIFNKNFPFYNIKLQ